MFKKIIKLFLKGFYKIKPLEIVKYYKTRKMVQAKITKAEDGSTQMKMKGEKYPFPGFPRQHILYGSLRKLKYEIRRKSFNKVYAEVQKILPDMLPYEALCPAVKEIWRVMTILEEAEVTSDMKSFIHNLKKLLCFWFTEDDAYRFRLQFFLENLNIKKVKLSKADKYYFRAKHFKADFSDPDSYFGSIKNDVLY